MKTSYNLRLPEELCGKIEEQARRNNMSINQYLLYTLTKIIFYNEAQELVKSKLSAAAGLSAREILKQIPTNEPLAGDEWLPAD